MWLYNFLTNRQILIDVSLGISFAQLEQFQLERGKNLTNSLSLEEEYSISFDVFFNELIQSNILYLKPTGLISVLSVWLTLDKKLRVGFSVTGKGQLYTHNQTLSACNWYKVEIEQSKIEKSVRVFLS